MSISVTTRMKEINS